MFLRVLSYVLHHLRKCIEDMLDRVESVYKQGKAGRERTMFAEHFTHMKHLKFHTVLIYLFTLRNNIKYVFVHSPSCLPKWSNLEFFRQLSYTWKRLPLLNKAVCKTCHVSKRTTYCSAFQQYCSILYLQHLAKVQAQIFSFIPFYKRRVKCVFVCMFQVSYYINGYPHRNIYNLLHTHKYTPTRETSFTCHGITIILTIGLHF